MSNLHPDRRLRSKSPYRSSHKSRSPYKKSSHRSRSRSRSPKKINFNDSKYSPSWGPKSENDKDKDNKKSNVEVIKPNFELSGKLYAEKMTVNGVVLKYAQPVDSVMPISKWYF